MKRNTLARVLPFAAYILFIVVADLLRKAGLSDADLRWVYPVKIAVVLVMLAVFWRDYDELHGAKMPGQPGAAGLPAMSAMSVGHWMLALVVGLAVFVAWINLHLPWMVIGKAQGFDPRGAGQALDWFFVVVRWCGAALVVPVMEELFWRSFIMRWIDSPDFTKVDPAQTSVKAFALTAALFAIEHDLWFAGLVAGCAYNFLFQKSRNLWSPIVAHAVTNGVLGGWVLATGQWSYW
jgi:CAAX prenyl protease-like protein